MKGMVFFFIIFLPLLGYSKPLHINTSCKSAILINADNGKILYEKNAQDRFFPASTTKVATALYVLETVSDINQKVPVDSKSLQMIDSKVKHAKYDCKPYLLEPDGTMLGLYSSAQISLKDLLYGALLCSGNDAANVLAQALCGSISHFMEELNEYLSSIGCKNTLLKNPHGLHFPEHYSSAYDLAQITKKALKNDLFFKIVTASSYQPEFRNKPIKQNNQLVLPEKKFYYPQAIGVKTGYTKKAGYNLIAAAKGSDRTLIAVVLGCEQSKDRYETAIQMFDRAFEEKQCKKTFFKQGQEFEKKIKGAKTSLFAYIKGDIAIHFFPSEKEDLKMYIDWEPLDLPIQQGQEVGRIIIKEKDLEISSQPLYAKDQIQTTFLYWIKQFFFK